MLTDNLYVYKKFAKITLKLDKVVNNSSICTECKQRAHWYKTFHKLKKDFCTCNIHVIMIH